MEETTATPKPAYEQDTADSEDISNLVEFIIPSDISSCDQFSFSYNRKLFSGWVKQPSPCCGAAVVAGAWNALRNVHRSHEKAATHLDILRIYEHIFIDMIDRENCIL